MMTKAYLESVIGRMGEKAEIIIFARDALAYLDRSETAEAERDALAERIGEKIREIARLRKVCERLEGERNESRKDVANYERQIEDARDILGAAPDELLSDAAKRAVRAVESVYPGPQVLREILGAAEGQGVIPAARAVVTRVKDQSETISEARQILGALHGQALGVRASDVMAELRLLREAAEAEPPQADLRGILRARDGESLGDAARRLAASRDEMMEEASRARTELGARADESAEDAALRVMRSLLKAQSALGEVFEIQHEITIAGDLVTIRVAPLRDPAIRALPLGVRLGLVVCDG